MQLFNGDRRIVHWWKGSQGQDANYQCVKQHKGRVPEKKAAVLLDRNISEYKIMSG